MPKENNIGSLTNRDMDVLEILWSSSEPLTVSEIVSKGNEDLTINTVNAVARKLLKLKLVEVADIVYHNTSLCRSFRPTAEARETILTFFITEFKRFHSQISMSSLVAALLDSQADKKTRETELQALEQYLDEYRRSIEKRK